MRTPAAAGAAEQIPAAAAVVQPAGDPRGELFARAGLSPRDVRILAALYFDGLSTREVAEAEGVWQTSIIYAAGKAAAKLRAAGVELPDLAAVRAELPGPELALCDPATMDRLIAKRDGDAGVTVARWADAKDARRGRQ